MASPTPKAPPGPLGEDLLPVETFLAGGISLPKRLKADLLTVRFASNLSPVVFECAPGGEGAFSPCLEGDAYDFGPLVHGQAYRLAVRARFNEDRVDQEPLVLSFVVDQVAGKEPELSQEPPRAEAGPRPGGGRLPESARDLPGAQVDAASGGRELQVGSFTAAKVPPGFQVVTYATTKTYNSVIRLFWLRDQPPGGPLPEPEGGCEEQAEGRPVAGPEGLTYCEANPSRSEWLAWPGDRLPQNHVALARPGTGPSGATEQILVAAFDEEADPAEQAPLAEEACQGAVARGESLERLYYGDLLETELRWATFSWCQRRPSSGQWQWWGTFTARLGEGGEGAPRVRVVYQADARFGIYAGAQFAALARERLRTLLVPIAPVSLAR